MAQISLSKEFIIQRLQEINFPQINQEDYNDYASLILALEDNHFSRYQFKQELMEVFSKEGENEEEDKESALLITETKINTLLQEIYKEKLHLKNQTHLQIKAKLDQKQQLKQATGTIPEKHISKQKESEKNRIFQFKRASEQAAASTKLTQEQRKNSNSFSNKIPKTTEKQNYKEKLIQIKVEKKQGILSRIKLHNDQLPQDGIEKKVKKEQIDPTKQVINQKQPNIYQIHPGKSQQDYNNQTIPAVEAQLQQMQQMNQMYQMMLSAMQSQTKTKIKIKQKMRCKYWPNCKEGEQCQYHHPKEKCKNFPNCQFGSQCLYIHPEIPCKFGIKCKRPNCAYTHKPQLVTIKTVNDQNQQQNQQQNSKLSEKQINEVKSNEIQTKF